MVLLLDWWLWTCFNVFLVSVFPLHRKGWVASLVLYHQLGEKWQKTRFYYRSYTFTLVSCYIQLGLKFYNFLLEPFNFISLPVQLFVENLFLLIGVRHLDSKSILLAIATIARETHQCAWYYSLPVVCNRTFKLFHLYFCLNLLRSNLELFLQANVGLDTSHGLAVAADVAWVFAFVLVVSQFAHVQSGLHSQAKTLFVACSLLRTKPGRGRVTLRRLPTCNTDLLWNPGFCFKKAVLFFCNDIAFYFYCTIFELRLRNDRDLIWTFGIL